MRAKSLGSKAHAERRGGQVLDDVGNLIFADGFAVSVAGGAGIDSITF